jgi:predicted nucleic acid-binding protein
MSFDLDRISSKTASKIYRDARKKGFTIGQFDSLIAGIFLSNGVNKILTRNKKDFEKMKGITVVEY